jgi:two-component system sensor histidine kinase DegS
MIKILNQAENLTLRFGVAISYLKNNLEHMEEHLQDLKNKQNFAAQIIKVQEEERKRVARDIHDGPCQTMANVIIHAEICEKLFDKDREQAKGELDELKHIVRGCLNELRKIIFDLRPPALDDLGLEAVVDRYCNDFQENTGIEVVFKKYGDKLRFNSNIEIAIFRIIQEALINIKKHSDAKHATVKLEIKNNLVNLLIADDGKGFNWDLSHDYSEKDRHFGLINIKERVELLNGSVKIETSPGYGTKIFISISLQGKEAEDE